MQNVINYRKLIGELEDEKWNLLVQHGDVIAALKWEAIDKKLTPLYRWWANDLEARVRRTTNEVLVERENSRR